MIATKGQLEKSSFEKMLRVAMIWLIIAGVIGFLMRLAFVYDLPPWIEYKHLLHTHSHLAMMGWLYSALFILILKVFNLSHKKYITLFWLTQVTSLGMCIFFPIQGYGGGSIFFTTCHMILSYLFAYMVIKDKKVSISGNWNYPVLFLHTALLLMVLSTIGTWALGVMMATSMKGSPLYYASIQFFLHFQFNGWYIFGTLAIFLKVWYDHNFIDRPSKIRYGYWLLLISCFLTYALSITWSTPENFIFYINSLGVFVQLIALYFIYQFAIRNFSKQIQSLPSRVKGLLFFSLFCIAFKILIQSLVAIPALAVVSYTLKNFIIGFIHLLMLGGITSFIMAMIPMQLGFQYDKLKHGITLFLVGFVASEILLFVQGIMLWFKQGFIPYYYHALATASVLMPMAFIWIFFMLKRKKVR